MYVGVIFYKFKPGSVKGGVKEWEEMVLKEAKRQQAKGMNPYSLKADTACLTVSY